MKLRFLGAARTVTGSFFVMEANGLRFGVDCGMFQGGKDVRERNYQNFVVNPRELDFLILTHAHIDHSGLIPKLCNFGFKGPIYCTYATAELATIMLPDSGHIQEMEVERKNRSLVRAGKPPLRPIYTVEEAEKCLSQFRPVNYDEMISPAKDIQFRLRDAGHILGSAVVELWVTEPQGTIKLVFTGDIGRSNQPFVKDPTPIESADYLIMESTYGNRLHQENFNRQEMLREVIQYTMTKGGNLIIPSFAVERTQDLLFDLSALYEKGELSPDIPIYLDSPLAISATDVFRRMVTSWDDETRRMHYQGRNPLDLPNLKFSRTVQESMRLNDISGGAIIISASGMCDAGRIKYHLKQNLWRPEATILFVGYQAQGTLGRRILDGEKLVRIHGEEIVVKADIRVIEGYSAHADRAGLLSWLKNFKVSPMSVFLVHGEEEALSSLADAIKREFRLRVAIPNWLDEIELAHRVETEMEAPVGFEERRERLAEALQAEEMYLKVRLKLNELFQEHWEKGDYQRIIEYLNKIDNTFAS